MADANPADVANRHIEAAARRLRGRAVATPLLESSALNERVGGRVLVKAETLQRIGAFKFRGAYNRLAQLDRAARRRGVVAYSSGNHAQGVALAARLLAIPAVIVMPADAPAVKLEATHALGAQIRLYDRLTERREIIAAEIAAARGAALVPSFDDPAIIAGQGTVGREVVRQARRAAAELDVVVGPIGGGGLMAGVSIAVHAASAAVRIVGVEPEGFDDTRRSLDLGHRTGAPPAPRSLCDALESPMPGEITFPILRAHLAGVVTVSDAEVAAAMRYAFLILKLVVEPGGCVALAALLADKLETAGKTTAIILSGGNVDPGVYAKVLAGEIYPGSGRR